MGTNYTEPRIAYHPDPDINAEVELDAIFDWCVP